MKKEEIGKRNRLREQAEKELVKTNCHICENAIFQGNTPHERFVGYYNIKTGEIKITN